MSNHERDFDTFMQLKKSALQDITEKNAAQKLQDCQIEVVKAWKTLNVQNITAVEDFYLKVAKLFHVVTYVAASQKTDADAIEFDSALFKISTDDLLTLLSAEFKNKLSPEECAKIQTIEELYVPSKQAWSALHARMHIMVEHHQQLQRYCDVGNALKTPLAIYLNHLEAQLKMHGVPIPIPAKPQQTHARMVEKMINRYNVIASLHHYVKGKTDFNKEDIKYAKRCLRICFQNEPDWFERPFLHQLLDVLSFGTIAFYRTFFSTERKLQDDVEEPLQLTLG